MKLKNQYRAANVAWILIELVSISTLIVKQGSCIGEIGYKSISFDSKTVTRVTNTGFLKKLFERLLTDLHKRFLHRPSCYSIGVSDRSLKRIIKHLSPDVSRNFLVEAVESALKDINATAELLPREHGVLGFSALDVFESSFSSRITPIAPAISPTKDRGWNSQLNRIKEVLLVEAPPLLKKVSTRFLDHFRKLPAQDGF